MFSVGNPFARTLPVPQKKQIQPSVQKVDTAREDIKKRILESFDSQSELIENAKFSLEELAIELENVIFEITGKNSRDKSYREKSKKILSRLKGARNSQLRASLRTGKMNVSDFCKLSDKQLDDDSYFEKLFNNGTKTPEPKKTMTRPPNIKNIPLKKIDLTSSFGEGVNEYFDNINSNPVTEGINEGENNNLNQETESPNEPKLALFTEDNNVNNINNMNFEQQVDNDTINKNDKRTEIKQTEIKTNYVINPPVVDAITLVNSDHQIERISPKINPRSINFNPIRKNDLNENKVKINQTLNIGGIIPNISVTKEKEIEIPNLNIESVGKAHNKLEELKGLMQKHKQV
jgi:hypothetical protein